MAISEERLQLLLPSSLKAFLKDAAARSGLTVGAYIRRLIEKERKKSEPGEDSVSFPFGENPIRSGRTRGSVDHDRPGV